MKNLKSKKKEVNILKEIRKGYLSKLAPLNSNPTPDIWSLIKKLTK